MDTNNEVSEKSGFAGVLLLFLGVPLLAHSGLWLWALWPLHGIAGIPLALLCGIVSAVIACAICGGTFGLVVDMGVASCVGLIVMLGIASVLHTAAEKRVRQHPPVPQPPAVVRIVQGPTGIAR